MSLDQRAEMQAANNQGRCQCLRAVAEVQLQQEHVRRREQLSSAEEAQIRLRREELDQVGNYLKP